MIDISIIMLVYNEEKYLCEAIDSILCQTADNFEFIIIDDASTDNSLSIIQSYSDKRIVLIRNEQNIGNYPSRNKGMEVAIGKYICVMGADDIAYLRRLEVQYEYMETHSAVSVLGTNFIFSKTDIKKNLLFSHEQIMIKLLQNNAVLHPSLMIRSDVMRKHGGYNEKYVYSSDYDLIAWFVISGTVENLPDILMMYRMHESQISNLHREEQNIYADEIRRKFQIEFIIRYKNINQQTPDEWVIGIPKESTQSLINKHNLIQFLDRLDDIGYIDGCLLNDIRKIDDLRIFPERIKRLLSKNVKGIIALNEINKPLDDIVTFVIPVRIDSAERKDNLDVVLEHLSKREQGKIIVLKADNEFKYKVLENYTNVTYHFVKDDNLIIYRTKYLNVLLREAETSIVGIWDTDVIVPDEQINESIADIRNGRAVMSYPYDGHFNFCSLDDSFVFRENRVIEFVKDKIYHNCVLHFVGEAFLVHKDYYMEAGGENEHFYGWGMEDMERVKRIEILGLPVSRASGSIYHMFHYRYENFHFYAPMLEN